MAFADVSTPKTFKKSQFLRLDVGEHTIRILDENATSENTHFIISRGGRATVKCLGDDCPACALNAQLKLEHPATYRNTQGYSTVSRKHSFNVLDRTEAKVCQKCQAVTKPRGGKYPSTCPECGSFISDVAPQPLNKVCLVTVSDTVAKDINRISNLNLDANREPIPVTNYDIVISVEQGSKGREMTVAPLPQRNDVVEVTEDLFDPTNAITALSKDEMIEFMRGVSIRDIFVARSRSREEVAVSTPKEEAKVAQVSEEADDMIKKLFGG